MQLLDEQIKKYEALDVPQTKREDFDTFWEETVLACMEQPLNVQGGPIEHALDKLDIRDITFEGLDGTPVHTWLILPPEAKDGPVPCVVFYHGAGGSRQGPVNHTQWTSMGCAAVVMDFRMQGGKTGSNTPFTGAKNLYFTVLGIGDKKTSYMYHVVTDGLRAIETALSTPEIDDRRIAVTGWSQGGGMSLAMAALHPAVRACAALVPSNCWMEKRLFERAGGFGQIAKYLADHPEDVDKVCATLSYFDHINLAERITCPVMMSVGLKDPICPAENAYAAYNKISSPKIMIPYPFNEHEGGHWMVNEEQVEFMKEHLFKGKS